MSQLKSDVPSEPIVDVKKNIEEEKKSEEKIIEKSKKEAVESDSESN